MANAEMKNEIPADFDDPRTRGELVDMMGQAKSAQFDGKSLESRGYVRVIAPAKVNLFLGIGQRRPDGYHDATSLMHALNLHDILYVGRIPQNEADGLLQQVEKRDDVALAGPNGNILVRVGSVAREGVAPLDIPAEKNIVFKAVDLLAKELGEETADAINIHLEKHIPHQGGLGGGSSDAAATLRAVGQLWGVDKDDPVLERVARKLGADVAFFLKGGCGLYAGTGDEFVRSLKPSTKNVVLIKPEGGVSTGQAYATFDANPIPVDEAALEAAMTADNANDVPVFNNLASASEELMPLLKEIREWAAQFDGVEDVLLCGSGATTFAVCGSFNAACRLATEAKKCGWWARTTAFGLARAAIMPKS